MRNSPIARTRCFGRLKEEKLIVKITEVVPSGEKVVIKGQVAEYYNVECSQSEQFSKRLLKDKKLVKIDALYELQGTFVDYDNYYGPRFGLEDCEIKELLPVTQ